MKKFLKEYVVIPVSDKKSLTPYVFYDYLLPTLSKCLRNKKESLISFDMTTVEKVSPLVLPNLIILGLILRNHFGSPVDLILSTKNLDVVHFLWRSGFFKLLDDYKLFTYDKGFVGGFAGNETGDLAFVRYEIVSNRSPEEIAIQMFRNNININHFFQHFEDVTLAETFAHTVGELAHNCSKHGRSPAIISFYGGPRMGLHCSVSDCGIGFRASLLEHPKDLGIYSKAELQLEHPLSDYKSIIEAVCMRFDKSTYGLSSVIRDIAAVGGTTRVHSGTTQVIFTERNQARFLKSKKTGSARIELSEALLLYAEEADSMQTSPVRIRNEELTGVHIEFEIPPLSNPAGGRMS